MNRTVFWLVMLMMMVVIKAGASEPDGYYNAVDTSTAQALRDPNV